MAGVGSRAVLMHFTALYSGTILAGLGRHNTTYSIWVNITRRCDLQQSNIFWTH